MKVHWVIIIFVLGSALGYLVGRGSGPTDGNAEAGQGPGNSSAPSSKSRSGSGGAAFYSVDELGMMSPKERLTVGLEMTHDQMLELSRKMEGKGHAGALAEIAAVVENLRPGNLQAAIDALQEYRDQGKHFEKAENAIWERIGEVDGERQLTNRIPEHSDDRPGWGVTLCMEGFAKAHPDDAATWHGRLEDGKFKTSLNKHVLTGISRLHPLKAVDFLISLPDDERSASFGRAAYMFVQNGGAEAADYWIEASAKEVSEEEARKAFDQSYSRMMYDHSFAAEWLGGETASRYFEEGRQAQFASSWAQKEPKEAANWTVSTGRQELLPNVISSCPDEGLSALADWLNSQNNEEFFQSAAGAFADRIGNTDSEGAKRWREASGSE